jgi:hypothetical protein
MELYFLRDRYIPRLKGRESDEKEVKSQEGVILKYC